MNIMMPTACDFSETSLDAGRRMLVAPDLHSLKVYVSNASATLARRLQGDHGFELVVVPDHMMPSPYSWNVEYMGKHAWSRGCI